ncbi:MoaD/ThiS family protein [Pseudaminobacter sp. NGMCC 1.201702]|uniref:MoaD/ThiS family protein n=1 Tax=Pseudaminobacter sp. NGMCC 1.201702 TaxID=3391825 RepID=UPI0039EF12BC
MTSPRNRDSATDGPPIVSTPVTVVLPGVLVDLFPGAARRVEMSAATVNEMMDELNARWPGMRDRLCDSSPAIRRHINVFVDGERAALKTPLSPGAEIFVLTAISGG